MVLKIPEFDFSAVEIGDLIGGARKHQGLEIHPKTGVLYRLKFA
jgi:hypothetical protein